LQNGGAKERGKSPSSPTKYWQNLGHLGKMNWRQGGGKGAKTDYLLSLRGKSELKGIKCTELG